MIVLRCECAQRRQSPNILAAHGKCGWILLHFLLRAESYTLVRPSAVWLAVQTGASETDG